MTQPFVAITVNWTDVFALITFQTVLLLVVGVIAGVVLGAIPGLSGTIGLAVAIPFTLNMDPVPAMSLLAGIYKGSMFGGAISSICFGIPGTPSSAPTVFDGYPLAKQGQPRKALEVAHYSGVAADFFSDVVLIISFAPLAAFALNFGPRELFALLTVAVALLAIFISDNIVRGFIAIAIGMFLGTVGVDPIGGSPRFTFGITALRGGVQLVPLLIGLFAISEVMQHIKTVFDRRRVGEADQKHDRVEFESHGIRVSEWFKRTWKETLLGAVLGTSIGTVPGPGATLSSFTAYGVASRWKKNRGKFGKGAIEGVAAAEAADSATAGSTLVPLFGLGIPGSAMAALFAAALMLQGITPGPSMIRSQPAIIYAFFVMLMIGSLTMLLVVHRLIPVFARASMVPARILAPVLGGLAVLGVYATSVSKNAVAIALIAGAAGYVLRAYKISLGGIVMAFIIAPIFEASLRRALIIARGDVLYMFASPLAVVLYVVGIVTAVLLLRIRETTT